MTSVEAYRSRLAMVTVPVFIVAFGCGLSLLPHRLIVDAMSLLAAWLSLAFPLSVFVGHCVLDELDCP